VPVYKYIVHFDEDIVGEDIVHGLFVMGHGYDLIVSVCDGCLDKFEVLYGDISYTDDGAYQSGAYCNYCRVRAQDGGVDEKARLGYEYSAEEIFPGPEQLKFDFVQ